VRSRILIVIPARYASTRFPGKPLVLISGISLIERVYRICKRVSGNPKVVVATDDRRIERHVSEFGGEVMMTRRNHPSGTDRVAEVARRFPHEVVINVQGDEPLLQPQVIQKLATTLLKDKSLAMATLAHSIATPKDYMDPNVVKVVITKGGHALYFSRSPIPHIREVRSQKSEVKNCLRHVGIYAFRRDFLFQYVRWPQTFLEKAEKLEQLRALENGVGVRVLKTNYHAIGVDVPADIRKIERILKANG
jgi:3-deoxy-manno-octulosonate cytidylyltransferase (CMP-KDO synthetase)